MALSRLNDYLEIVEGKNSNGIFDLTNIKGISTKKEFIPTKANMDGISLTTYKIVEPMCFAYVADTSRRGEKISLAFNDTNEVILVSSITTVFRVKPESKLIPKYLFIYFNRPEFDRYSRFNSWGSAREAFGWEDMCDIEIDIPPIEVQQKVVEVYLAMVANQKVYEKGLDDLKQTYEAYIENLRRKSDKKPIMEYLYESFDRNIGSSTPALGVSIEKKFIEAKRESTIYENYKIVKLNEFAFRPVLDKMDSSFTLALNRTVNCAVSPAYIVFGTNADVLLPQYLMLWLSRKETERWLAFNAWGSARNTIELSDLGRLEIPIPSIKFQKDIVDVYEAYEMRKKINVNLKKQINEICPVLIKGSITLNH
jgi:type I restriction enzyme S subunit